MYLLMIQLGSHKINQTRDGAAVSELAIAAVCGKILVQLKSIYCQCIQPLSLVDDSTITLFFDLIIKGKLRGPG